MVEINSRVAVAPTIVTKNHRTLESMCMTPPPISDDGDGGTVFVGRVKRIGRRRHYGAIEKLKHRCPWRVHMVISDCSRELSVIVWGTLAIRAHAQLQVGVGVSQCRYYRHRGMHASTLLCVGMYVCVFVDCLLYTSPSPRDRG